MKSAVSGVMAAVGLVSLFSSSAVFAGVPTCPAGYGSYNPKGGFCTAAPITTAGSGSRRDNKLYAGINWKFGAVKAPEVVVGYQSVKVQSDKDVRGARLEFSALLKNGFSPNAVKLQAVDGRTGAQGLLGGGYAFGQGFLLNAGLQIPYATGGIDYVVGGGLTPYAGINTLRKQKVPSGGGGTACPSVSDTNWESPFLSDGVCITGALN